MNKFITTLLGVMMFVFALQSIITGETFGITAGSMHAREIIFSDEPKEFIFVIILQVLIGIWLLKDVFSKS